MTKGIIEKQFHSFTQKYKHAGLFEYKNNDGWWIDFTMKLPSGFNKKKAFIAFIVPLAFPVARPSVYRI